MEEKMKYKFRIPFCSGNKTITYVDENDFKKKYKGLRHVCPTTFKYLCFEVFSNSLFETEKGKYTLELPTDKLFEQVYGKVKLIYSVTNNAIVIEDLKPNDILLSNYMKSIEIYRGVPCSTEKDKFKINLIMKMRGV